MSYAKMKETTCEGLEWNYNDIDVGMTQRCQIDGHQNCLVPTLYDDNLKQRLIILSKTN